MAHVYSAYEAKAKFSEVIRRVRAGQRITITHRDEAVAEIRPIDRPNASLERSLRRLEDEGTISRPRMVAAKLKPLVKKHGALARFLDSRE